MSLRIGLVAAEHSGDALGAGLIQALSRQYSGQISFEGIPGPLMREAGCCPIIPMEKIMAGGLTEILSRLPQLYGARQSITRHFLDHPPDVFIGIDAPDFNLDLECKLKKSSTRTVHYVSPTVWAWRHNRIKKVAKAVDLLLTLLPFEASFYEAHHIPTHYVGHPLADQITGSIDKQQARTKLGIAEKTQVIAMLPGSRNFEVKYLGRLFLDTALWCLARKRNLQFVVPMVSAKLKAQFDSIANTHPISLPMQIFTGPAISHQVMAAADVVLTASGTATLECMLMNRPMVVAYRLSEITYRILKRIVKAPYCALPNLLSNQMLIPEFLQQHATPENLGRSLLEYLVYPDETERLIEKYQHYASPLRQKANEKAARKILEIL